MPNAKKVRPGEVKEINGIRIEAGSGNVFRDLGLPRSEHRQAKARISEALNDINAGRTTRIAKKSELRSHLAGLKKKEGSRK